MGNRTDWEEIERLGGGGQSDVYLVRNPKRRFDRAKCLDQIRSALDGDKRAELATAIWSYARADLPSELGALKAYKIRQEGFPPAPGTEESEAIERLRTEITVLSQNRPSCQSFWISMNQSVGSLPSSFQRVLLNIPPTDTRGKRLLLSKPSDRLYKQWRRCT